MRDSGFSWRLIKIHSVCPYAVKVGHGEVVPDVVDGVGRLNRSDLENLSRYNSNTGADHCVSYQLARRQCIFPFRT